MSFKTQWFSGKIRKTLWRMFYHIVILIAYTFHCFFVCKVVLYSKHFLKSVPELASWLAVGTASGSTTLLIVSLSVLRISFSQFLFVSSILNFSLFKPNFSGGHNYQEGFGNTGGNILENYSPKLKSNMTEMATPAPRYFQEHTADITIGWKGMESSHSSDDQTHGPTAKSPSGLWTMLIVHAQICILRRQRRQSTGPGIPPCL